ncbi:MAG TPA: Gfo/Idh/MocA family oxidoreductase, partial [Fodinibius sp.]|nr:Gfo/Idh/MocA family oxidoreductase [Fodinibius sp.]
MKEIQVGFIGSGFIANFMVEAMQQVRGINISALYKRSGTSALADVIRHKELGELKIYDSIEEVCNHCDVVAIMTPNHTRVTVVEAIVDAVKKGAPLKAAVCEKPLGRTVAEARRIVELADEADLLTFYFENQLHMSSINKALKQLKPQQEAMGPLVLARSTEEHAGP